MARRKFVFNVDENGEEAEHPESGTDSDSDMDIVDDNEALEKDLASLDNEQAEFIRKINKMGNLSFHDKAANSLRNTLTARNQAGSAVTLPRNNTGNAHHSAARTGVVSPMMNTLRSSADNA